MSWPEAVVIIAFCAMGGFGFWCMTKTLAGPARRGPDDSRDER